MTREEAQAAVAGLVRCEERSCVAVPGWWDCTGGHGANCPKGRPHCVIMLGTRVLANGDTWEESFATLRAKVKAP